MGGHHARIFSQSHWSCSQHAWTLSLCDQRWEQRKSFICLPGWQYFSKMSPLRSYCSGEFPGGLVVRTPSSHCQKPGLDPWSGSYVAWLEKKKEKERERKKSYCSRFQSKFGSWRVFFLYVPNSKTDPVDDSVLPGVHSQMDDLFHPL